MKNNIIKLILAIGFITLSSAISAQKQRIDSLVIKNGSQGLNKVLVCDTNGNATWSTNSDAAWFNTNTNTGATKVNDTMYHTGRVAISDVATTPDTNNVRASNAWNNNLYSARSLTNYSKLVNTAGWFGQVLETPAAGAATGFYDAIGAEVRTAASTTNNFNWVTGLNTLVGHQGSGTVSIGQGAIGQFENYGAGTVTNAYGTKGYSRNSGTGTIVNSYGLYSQVLKTASATTNNGYGLYIENVQATNDWGVYQADTSDNNYFAGHTSIGNFSAKADTNLHFLSIPGQYSNVLAAQESVKDYTTKQRYTAGTFGLEIDQPATAVTQGYFGTHNTLRTKAGSSGAIGFAYANFSEVDHLGNSNIGTALGGFNIMKNNGSGTITTAFGTQSHVSNRSTGIITNAFVSHNTGFNSSTGSIGNLYGSYVGLQNGNGNVTNGYGLYVENINATNKWSIYTNSGRASIGDTLQLRTVPTGTATDEILVRRATTGDVYKISADSIGAKTEPWFNTNTLTGSIKVTDTIYHTGHAAMGNAFTTPDTSLNYATGTTKVQNITASQEILDDANFTANALWAAHMPSLRVTATTTAANRSIFGTNSSVFTAPTSTANISAMRAVASHAQHDGTGTISGMIGLSSAAIGNGGTVTDLRSGNFSARNTGTVASPSIVGTLYGVNAQLILSANSTTTNFYGYATAGSSYAAGYALTGNSYGLHISNMPAPTSGTGNDWGVYQADTSDNNYFAGKTAIGNASNNPDTNNVRNSNAWNNNLFSGRTLTDYSKFVNTAGFFGQVLATPVTGTATGFYDAVGAEIRTAATSTNNFNWVSGVNTYPAHQGSGTLTIGQGVYAQFENMGSGTITTSYGLNARVGNTGAGTTTTAYALRAGIDRSAGTITNGYGLYINDIQATNQWGIYQAGANDINFFAGATTFGGTDAVTVPTGTNTQRPATPVFGMVRYNSTIGRGEMYVNDLNGDGTQGDAGWRAF